MLDQKYYDTEGDERPLWWMVRNEPDWAVSRLQVGRYSEKEMMEMLAEARTEQRQLCADAVEELYSNNADATLTDEDYIHACLNAGGD